MQTGSILYAANSAPREMGMAAISAGSIAKEDKNLPPAGTRVTISDAARAMLQAEQAGGQEDGQLELEAAWESIRSQAPSPARAYAEFLKYELTQPHSSGNAVSTGSGAPELRGLNEARLAYLREYMGAGGGA